MVQEQQVVRNREALIDHTSSEWGKFVTYVDSLSDADWTGPADPAGWTVKDHVAHVTQWDIAITNLFRDGTPMQRTLESPVGEWNVDYESINERLRQRTIADSIEKVRSDRDAVWLELLDALRALTDEQLSTPAGEVGINVDEGDQTPLLPTLVTYLGGHYAAHGEMIRIIAEEGSRTP